MTNIKHIILILTPVIIVFFGVVWAVIAFLQDSPKQITYSDTPIINNSNNQLYPIETFQEFSNNGVFITEQDDDLLNSWQDSDNIKYSDYEDSNTLNDVDLSEEGVVIDTKQVPTEEEAVVEPNNPWQWLQRTVLKQPKPVQESAEIVAMRNYGNVYGGEIKSFAATTGNQPETMSNFIDGLGEPGNTDAILTLAQKYITIAEVLSEIDGPTNIRASGIALADAYKEVGEATIELSKLVNDESAVDYIYTYNNHVDNFAKKFVSFASVFGAYGIKFNKGEGGDILMPPM